MAQKTTKGLRRRSPTRQPRLRILAVAEGAKTEGLYLSLFVHGLRAANVQIEILGRECGSDPLTVVEFAASYFRKDPGIDLCYCVIDRDSHDVNRFNNALVLGSRINNNIGKRLFDVIVSDPCIEYWFLLHFVFRRGPFTSSGSKSRADNAIDALTEYLPKYRKNDSNEISKLFDLTDIAIANAEKAIADAEATGEPNPSTRLYVMIKRIVRESSFS